MLLHYRPTCVRRLEERGRRRWDSSSQAGARQDAIPRPSWRRRSALRALRARPEPPGDEHPQCLFPARWAWLKQQLGIDARAFPDQPCPLLRRLAHRHLRRGGHAGLRHRVPQQPGVDVRAHVPAPVARDRRGQSAARLRVNFAADVDTDNGMVYAIKGLTGGFQGRFYVMPYYVKVQEYSNMESRDLWEYELSLSRRAGRAAGDARLGDAQRPTSTTTSSSRNCSYQLLTLLEVADPALHLTEHFQRPRSIPADTDPRRAGPAGPGPARRAAPVAGDAS